MAPYLETVRSFTAVTTEGGVNTLEFLEATEGLIGLFDLLGSTAFTLVQTDLKGNVTKIRARYDAKPAESKTLEDLVKNEKAEKKNTATEGLMWLLRGLHFTCSSLQNLQKNKTEELSAAFSKGYESSLKQFHNFLVKGAFAVAMKACPYRADFYKKLAADPAGGPSASQDKVDQELDAWLAALAAIVANLATFYKDGGYGKVY